MPRKKQPARLWLRPDTGTWFIKDGDSRVATECIESDVAGAQRALANHIAKTYQPQRGGHSSEVSVADILIVYLQDKADATARPNETKAMIGRLNEYWGEKLASDIKGNTCRGYVKHRDGSKGARRDLEVLRAAVNYYHAEHGLDPLPKVTLPEKGEPRERWLTRQEVAALLRAARKTPQCGHLVRYIMIGLYTGTRSTAILGLQWMPNTTGGYVNLDQGVIYRKAEGERVAHNKRKTPVKVPPRLLRFLQYWKAADERETVDGETAFLRYLVRYQGQKVTKINKAFRKIRVVAGLDEKVVPHSLRHTRATWLAHKGVNAQDAAASLGLTVEEYERTYSHVSPDFQESAANAF